MRGKDQRQPIYF